MSKKIISVLMAAIIAVLSCITSVSASDIAVCDVTSAQKTCHLTISANKANCQSAYSDTAKAKSIKIEQSLEKHSFLWVWEKVGGAWTKSASNTSSLSLSNTKTGLSGGTYRVKTVFTVTTSDGRTETVTVYSSEKTI